MQQAVAAQQQRLLALLDLDIAVMRDGHERQEPHRDQ